MRTTVVWCALALVVASVACGDDDDTSGDDDDDVAAIDAAIPDAGPPDSAFSGEICDDSPSGSSTGLDCAAFCAPLMDLACANVVRNSTCVAWCEQLKVDCIPQFNHFIDCAGPVPGWACIGTTLIAGSCTVSLDCPCLNPVMQGCSGDMDGIVTPGPTELVYTATLADCIDIDTPNPDDCNTAAGTAELTVDQSTEIAGNDNVTAAAMLTFTLDDAFTAGEVTAVTLELATGGFGADGDQSGDVWELAPFVRADLFTATPAKVGADPVGPGIGQVISCEVISWPLSLAVEPSTTVYLGVFPTSTNGVDYFGLGGAFEPRLRITR